MPISCACYETDENSDGWWYFSPADYKQFQMKNRKRCCSCKTLIAIGDISTEFKRYRRPTTEIEECIRGDVVSLASWWMCETCSDLFFSITELGFCVTIGGNLKEEVKDVAYSEWC